MSSRSVRHLLIRGARRDLKNNYGLTPGDFAAQIKNQTMKKEILSILVNWKLIDLGKTF